MKVPKLSRITHFNTGKTLKPLRRYLFLIHPVRADNCFMYSIIKFVVIATIVCGISCRRGSPANDNGVPPQAGESDSSLGDGISSLEGIWKGDSVICDFRDGTLKVWTDGELVEYPQGSYAIIEKGVAELTLPNQTKERFVFEVNQDGELVLGFLRSGPLFVRREK